jgi:hypothetical protein
VELEIASPQHTGSPQRLLVLLSEELDQWPRETLENSRVVALCRESEEKVYARRRTAYDTVDLAVAFDPREEHRLNLMHPLTGCASNMADALRLSALFAETRDCGVLQAPTPTPPSDHPVVMIQVDNFSDGGLEKSTI